MVEFIFPLKTTLDVTPFDNDGILFGLDAVVWVTAPFGWVYTDDWLIEIPVLVSLDELACGFTEKQILIYYHTIAYYNI